ncbi:hypothetical protein CHARACLAT_003244 [Characodon lateralis]|uniref:Uncharacterized protein n=1 Tax=Characodon lateralis TaxID=208331 RepID=A0ABU7DMW4_9TELE|nr:hypothetical protein [Characodon lateralis]
MSSPSLHPFPVRSLPKKEKTLLVLQKNIRHKKEESTEISHPSSSIQTVSASDRREPQIFRDERKEGMRQSDKTRIQTFLN